MSNNHKILSIAEAQARIDAREVKSAIQAQRQKLALALTVACVSSNAAGRPEDFADFGVKAADALIERLNAMADTPATDQPIESYSDYIEREIQNKQ